MKPSPRRDDFPIGAMRLGARGKALLGAALLLFSVAACRAEDLLTQVLYSEGSSTYTLLTASGNPDAQGRDASFNKVRAGMSLPSLARIDTSGDGKLLLSPTSQIKYVIQPGTRVVNEALSYHSHDPEHTIDYRLRLIGGTVVGDVQALPHNVGNVIVTPLGTAYTANGHFLIAVRPDGSTKFAVLVGTLTINLTARGIFTLSGSQVLNVLSDSAKARILADHQGEIVGGTPDEIERQKAVAILNAGGEDLKISSLQDDASALALLTAPMPEPNGDTFDEAPAMVQLELLPGELPPYFNPADLPNPYNTPGNPPVSPISP